MKHIRAKLHCNKYQIRDQNKLFWLKADCGLVIARHKPLSLRLLPIGCQQAIFYFLALVLGYIFGTFQSPSNLTVGYQRAERIFQRVYFKHNPGAD